MFKPHHHHLKVSTSRASKPVISDSGCRAAKFVVTLGGPHTPSMVKLAEDAKVSLVVDIDSVSNSCEMLFCCSKGLTLESAYCNEFPAAWLS